MRIDLFQCVNSIRNLIGLYDQAMNICDERKMKSFSTDICFRVYFIHSKKKSIII